MTRATADTLRHAGADRLTRSQRSRLLDLVRVYQERNPGTRMTTAMVANWVTSLLSAPAPDRTTRADVLAAADRVEAEGRPLMARAMRKRAAGMATEAQLAAWRRRDRLDDAAVRRAAAPPADADPFARTDPDIVAKVNARLDLLHGDGDPLGLDP